ncbi:MAG: isochorismatase family protein [Chloroflexota bacterium]
MSILNLNVRYFQDSTPSNVPCREENFVRREIPMALPVAQTALVLVDVWNIHFIESWLERAKQVTIKSVVPVLDAARTLGLTVIHAPSPPVAEQFAQVERHESPPKLPDPTWPPLAFRRRKGEYTAFRGPRDQPPSIGIHWDKLAPQLSISSAIQVLDHECMVATGQQLHDFLEERRILHLIYAGFATNWCILNRDYGMRAMAQRGYNLILLRDATTGVEFPDTLYNLFTTEMAIREVEQQCGFSASNDDFFAACKT